MLENKRDADDPLNKSRTIRATIRGSASKPYHSRLSSYLVSQARYESRVIYKRRYRLLARAVQ